MQRVMDVLSLKEYHARTLLIHYRWDVDKVLAVYVERGKELLYGKAGVTMEEEHDTSQLSSEVMCDICMEEIPANEVTVMDCNHCFCNKCKYSARSFSLMQNYVSAFGLFLNEVDKNTFCFEFVIQ